MQFQRLIQVDQLGFDNDSQNISNSTIMADRYQRNPYDGDIFQIEDIKLFHDATKDRDKKGVLFLDK